MGTYCLCSTLLRFPLYYPHCLVTKRLQPTSTITVSSYVCQQPRRSWRKPITEAILAAAAAVILAVNRPDAVAVAAAEIETQQEILGETFSNVPQTLSGDCVDGHKDCKKARIQRPKSRQAEICTVKCVNTCIRGGSGSPGEGPLNVRSDDYVDKMEKPTDMKCKLASLSELLTGHMLVDEDCSPCGLIDPPLVVFKQGFRSRQYCLVECSDICNLMKDGEDGP